LCGCHRPWQGGFLFISVLLFFKSEARYPAKFGLAFYSQLFNLYQGFLEWLSCFVGIVSGVVTDDVSLVNAFLGLRVLSFDEVDGGKLVKEADLNEKHLIFGSLKLLIGVIKDFNGVIHALDGLINLSELEAAIRLNVLAVAGLNAVLSVDQILKVKGLLDVLLGLILLVVGHAAQL
jgi:hypothetical protein